MVRGWTVLQLDTMNYPKKPGFNLYQSRHSANITYSVKTWFSKILSVCIYIFIVARGFFNEENKILYGINEGEQGKQNKEVKMKRKGKRGAKDTKKAVKLSFLSEKES